MIFSVRQLQEKCREQQQPLYIAFVDLTKAFDLVSRSGLFQVLERIGCPPTLLSIIKSFHSGMKGTISYDGELSEPFEITSGVKQGCVLAPTLFGIFFSAVLMHAFKDSADGVYIRTRHDGKLYNLARLRAKTKTLSVLIRELLFADDAAITSHTQAGLQRLMDRFSKACQDFSLTISIKKTEVLAQDATSPPQITINRQELAVVNTFKYLGSTISDNLSLDKELSARIGKASSVMFKLGKRVWDNKNLSLNTKMKVYQACIISTLLYGSETWTTYARQEIRLNVFHLRCLRRILGISWQDRVTNTSILSKAKSTTIQSMITERRLRWLGHVKRMQPGRIPKDLLYGQLETGSRPRGRPHLRFKDACKRDLKSTHIDIGSWEVLAENRQAWRAAVKTGVQHAEDERSTTRDLMRQRRKQFTNSIFPDTNDRSSSTHICINCGRNCNSRIGLFSHRRKCSLTD